MGDCDRARPQVLCVGGWSRNQLLAMLARSGVRLNQSAETLLGDAVFDEGARETITIIERSVGELGLCNGAGLSRIFAVAQREGLALCPPVTGPYLRLATLGQRSAPDSVMSNGRAPSASITIASPPLRLDDEYPKGFYLRVIDGDPWLRGYRASDRHRWSPEDCFAFRA